MIIDRINELQHVLDNLLPNLLVQNAYEEGEKEDLTPEQLERDEVFYDAAIAHLEDVLQGRIDQLKRRQLSDRGPALQKRIDEMGRRVSAMLNPDLTYTLIITSAYSNEPQGIATNLERPGLKSTLEVMLRDWDKGAPAYQKVNHHPEQP